MKTLLFCTSYADTLPIWNERWGKWLRAITQSNLAVDKILIVDDGSPVVPDWPDVDVISAENPDRAGGRICIHHFADRRGQRVNGEPFPGWYRSFSHAVLYAIRKGYDRIIHIEADAFLITNRAVEFFNSCDRGWVSLWCARHRWPESALQIINRDQFGPCEAFFSKSYSEHRAASQSPIEVLLPLTSVDKTLIGDRYGEAGNTIPFGADYAAQTKWGQPPAYYWWLSQEGVRRSLHSDRPTLAAAAQAYARDDARSIAHAGIDYRDFMRFLDQQLCPAGYLEIGTHQGDSVRTVTCDAICIDPNFVVDRNVIAKRAQTFFFQMTSDEFFAQRDPRDLLASVDLGFLDGLHHFEALLKDFINFERHAHPGTIALLHDCLPLNLRMAGRAHQPGPETEAAETRSFWTGDVWRILPILQEFRPDLKIVLLDCPPTGLVMCAGLDNRSTKLMFNYDAIVRRYIDLRLEDYGLERLWATFPILNTRKIVAEPRLFCESFRFRL